MALVPLPEYTRTKKLANGGVAYYWSPPTWAKKRECPVCAEPLGKDLVLAIIRAKELNTSFEAWRTGEDTGAIVTGSVAWLFRLYQQSRQYKKTAEKTQRGYLQGMELLENYVMESGRSFGQVKASKVAERHADVIYDQLQWVDDENVEGGRRRRLATANAAMRAVRRVWSVAIRKGWGGVKLNPFAKMELEGTGGHTVPFSRSQYEALVKAADEIGYPSIGTAAMLAFEFCQREEDVIGTIAWSDYKPGLEVRVKQQKTGKMVWMPLYDDDGELFPDLIDRLDATPKTGTLIIMRDKPDRRRKVHLPYDEHWFRKVYRKVRETAGLPAELKFMGLRHGGLTELGDAGATDQELMSHSGHKTRGMLTVYTKASSEQAKSAARKRRAWRAKYKHIKV